MCLTRISRSARETQRLGEHLGARLRGGEVIFLRGDLGVGKTQFAQGLGRGLEVGPVLVSPTFMLAVQYEGRLPLVHYDLYRVETQAELDEIGFLETDDAKTVAIVEWGDRTDVPPDAICIDLERTEDDARTIRISGARHRGLLDTIESMDADDGCRKGGGS